MADTDLSQVFSLIDRENWGWEFHEIRRIFALDTRNSIVAEIDGDIVGLITLINFGKTAFIVHVIVKEGWRKKKLGARMMRDALQNLDSLGVDNVELHAMPDAADFYNQFGFKKVEEISFFCKHRGTGGFQDTVDPPMDAEFRLLDSDETLSLSECQARMMGFHECDFQYALNTDLPECPVGRIVGGSTTAMLIARKGSDLNPLGPWFMNHPDRKTARAMLRYVIARLPDRRTDVGISSSNELAKEIFLDEGFSLMTEGVVRVSRSARAVSPFPRELLAIGHLGVI
ncbi:MAG: GNAT family N-acetyltransferase [Candidatus Thermoplasmatota archaeon]|nr:GNAT family N-acetyltransferase [Candidatus Thermoplasmatota archaeon]